MPSNVVPHVHFYNKHANKKIEEEKSRLFPFFFLFDMANPPPFPVHLAYIASSGAAAGKATVKIHKRITSGPVLECIEPPPPPLSASTHIYMLRQCIAIFRAGGKCCEDHAPPIHLGRPQNQRELFDAATCNESLASHDLNSV